MKFTSYNQIRVRDTNKKEYNPNGDFILYWMQAYRRLSFNHSLDFSIHLAETYNKSLVVYEGLRMNYPWSSERLHKFILEGFCDNKEDALKIGITYWPFVELPENKDPELLQKLSERAFAIVTDDFPCFIIPNHIEKISEVSRFKVFAVDGNGIIPLEKYGEPVSAARILRPRIHLNFSEGYSNGATHHKNLKKYQYNGKSNFPLFSCSREDISIITSKISFKSIVKPDTDMIGGRKEGLKKLKNFIKIKLQRYSEDRSNPNPPDSCATSGLSPYIHFGHISVQEIVEEVLNSEGKWSKEELNFSFKGKRENFFHPKEFINSFLDEALTWRDIGFHLFFKKPEFNKDLKILPNWVLENFKKHSKDKRPFLYKKSQFENCSTHDKLWNAAQVELVTTGKMHNYMRMLWGKKIIEWTNSYEEAFEILEDFNNKYAYDGRNPNSYSGILWCFGLFDRPWFPERPVLGNLRYMSSDSTSKKFKMQEYLRYISTLSGNKETLFG